MALIFTHIGFCASASLLFKSEQFPVAWRYNMFMNAPNSLVIVSFILAIMLVLPLHFFLIRTVKVLNESRINPAIYYIDFVAIFALLFVFTQSGLIANGMLDKTTAKTYTAKVIDKDVKYARFGESYYVYLEDWSNSENTVQIRVNDSKYESIVLGETLQVVTKQGFLGYEWIVNQRQIESEMQ